MVLSAALAPVQAARTMPLIIDHTCTDITLIPENAIINAKAELHIAYGHTSHGSQLTSGMRSLAAFADAVGKGLNYEKKIFTWNHGGSDNALDLHDYAMGGDAGYMTGHVCTAVVNGNINYYPKKRNTQINNI
jgi:hypothetical protein